MPRITLTITIDVPDGVPVAISNGTVPDDFASEPLPLDTFEGESGGNVGPITPIHRTMATAPVAVRAWQVGEVHMQGHKPLKAGSKGGVYCPTATGKDQWCSFRA